MVQIAPWAVTCVVLYLRSGAVLPLMIAHVAYDLMTAVTNRIAVRYGLAPALTVFAVFTVVVAITALGQRGPLVRQAGETG